MKKNLIALLVAFSASTSSFATIFDFANLKYNSTTNTNTGFLPTDGVKCTGGDLCSTNVNGNIFGDNLTYTSGGITVTATGYYDSPTIAGNSYAQVAVVQDKDNNYNGLLYGSQAIGAGLGVYHSKITSDDNITAGEMLKLSFDRTVTMSEFGMRAEGHNTTSWLTNASFEYSLNGLTWISALLPDNNVVGNTHAGRFLLGSTSKDFFFRYGGTQPIDQFYISSVTVAPVPEPETYAMMLAGLGLLGVMARRRKQKLNA